MPSTLLIPAKRQRNRQCQHERQYHYQRQHQHRQREGREKHPVIIRLNRDAGSRSTFRNCRIRTDNRLQSVRFHLTNALSNNQARLKLQGLGVVSLAGSIVTGLARALQQATGSRDAAQHTMSPWEAHLSTTSAVEANTGHFRNEEGAVQRIQRVHPAAGVRRRRYASVPPTQSPCPLTTGVAAGLAVQKDEELLRVHQRVRELLLKQRQQIQQQISLQRQQEHHDEQELRARKRENKIPQGESNSEPLHRTAPAALSGKKEKSVTDPQQQQESPPVWQNQEHQHNQQHAKVFLKREDQGWQHGARPQQRQRDQVRTPQHQPLYMQQRMLRELQTCMQQGAYKQMRHHLQQYQQMQQQMHHTAWLRSQSPNRCSSGGISTSIRQHSFVHGCSRRRSETSGMYSASLPIPSSARAAGKEQQGKHACRREGPDAVDAFSPAPPTTAVCSSLSIPDGCVVVQEEVKAQVLDVAAAAERAKRMGAAPVTAPHKQQRGRLSQRQVEAFNILQHQQFEQMMRRAREQAALYGAQALSIQQLLLRQHTPPQERQ
ncbi:hypothetical protein cyc_00375 [Cyclospora cayetanensis]|uniref:Uncharacterized protein n=1 Tax=Cyclospora cayetanensis TaxID=88456 RepID=A0A1D3CXT2_9EIME|nr:hypothetical protein cyc_00375 [Cyclospora cayetanensis]